MLIQFSYLFSPSRFGAINVSSCSQGITLSAQVLFGPDLTIVSQEFTSTEKA